MNEKPKYGMGSNTGHMIGIAWRSNKSVLLLVILQAMLGVGVNLVELYVLPTILKAVERHVPLLELIATILFFTGGLLLISAVSAYMGQNTLFGRVAVRGILVCEIHDKFSKTSYPNTEKQDFLKQKEKAIQTVSSNDQATEAIWNTLTELLKNGMGFLIYLMLLSSIDPFVVLITLATTITGYLISNRLNSWGYRHRDEEAEISRKMAYINRKVGDYSLAKDIRIFGMGNWLEELYDGAMKLYRDFCIRGERVYFWADITDILLAFLRNGIAYAYLISLTLKGGLEVSQFLLYFTAVGGFTAWVTGILSGFSTLHKQSLDISVVREFIEAREIFRFEGGEMVERAKEYSIELKNVTFRYPDSEKSILKNISLKINPGEKLAIVGLNGAGKTTLIKLLCGFYDPDEGEVLLNGKNIKEFNRRDYYRYFSAVFQNFSLLAASIAGNVAQSDSGIDMDRVRSCVDKAGLKQKIEALPEGYDTLLGKDVYDNAIELSGGEMQRLMLARALYKNSPIIVLDEPTAALDPIVESDIYNRYHELTGSSTSVYISHRLASTRFCDRVILLEDGVIAEEGSHEELIARGGRYAEVFQIQSRYYREGGKEEDGEEF